MAEIVYILSSILSIACAVLLYRGYRKNPSHLLLWSSLCFGLLAVNGTILFFDLVILPDINFNGIFWRNLISATAGSVLLFGLIWEMT
jgi:hypothetical protein